MIDYEGQEDPPDMNLEPPDVVCPGCDGSCEYVVSYMPDGSPVWAPCIQCMGPGA